MGGMTTHIKYETISAIVQVAVQTRADLISVQNLTAALIGAGLPDDLNTRYLAIGIRSGIWSAQIAGPPPKYAVA